ncbi:MAG: ComF family protein [Clostridiales bacterium]|nr:ComF family protein [Clostridiales bacterium]
MSLISDTVDWILPHKCCICGDVADVTADDIPGYKQLYNLIYGSQPDLHMCTKCLSRLTPVEGNRGWSLCLSNPYDGDPHPELALFAPFPYDDICDTAIPRIKFGAQKELARLFGIILGRTVKENNIAADLVVPVPLSAERLEERGFNQAEEMALPVAFATGAPLRPDVLMRKVDTARQTELRDNEARAENVRGAFEVSPEWDVEGLSIIVADDVATTGATLHEAACALLDKGASKVLCIAFASNRTVKNTETV